jgi:hypothetical protein
MKNEALIEDFKQSLIAAGKSKLTVKQTMEIVRRFLRHAGDTRLERVSEDLARAFFERYTGNTRSHYASVISQFLRFAARDLPALIDDPGSERIPVPSVKDRKEIAMRQAWEVEKQTEQREGEENLIARLARQLINHYVFFKRRIKGAPEDPDELYRFAGECEELIRDNLQLFMELSAKGLNVHAIINERSQQS